MSRPVAAITGASSGIGSVFARKLAARGYDLLLIARRKDRMVQLARELPGSHDTFACDLADPDGLRAAADRLAGQPDLELLVNNAGFGTKGKFYLAPLEEQQRMHRLHVDATLVLTHTVLGGMVKRDCGGIINVSSVAAFGRSPGNVSYCATKTWISTFTEGVHLELRNAGSKVKVQALCPGFTYSEFHDVAGIDRGTIARWLWMDADKVVDASIAGLDSGKLFVIPGWPYKLITSLLPRIPTSWRVRLEAASPHRRP